MDDSALVRRGGEWHLDRAPALRVALAVGVLAGAVLAGWRWLAYSWLEATGAAIAFGVFAGTAAVGAYLVARYGLILPGVLLALFLLTWTVPTDDGGLGNPIVGDVVITQLLLVVLLVAGGLEVVFRTILERIESERTTESAEND